jgi:hypothetical protein
MSLAHLFDTVRGEGEGWRVKGGWGFLCGGRKLGEVVSMSLRNWGGLESG